MDKLVAARAEINEIDKAMSALFEKRMEAVRKVAEYKAEKHLPILDSSREEEIINTNSSFISSPEIKAHYINFLKSNMQISRSYQAELYPELSSGILYEKENVKTIRMELGKDSYDILLGCSDGVCGYNRKSVQRAVCVHY